MALERQNIIEPSKSPWLNPVVLTRNKSGDLRLRVDFRKLNDLVQLEEFKIPKIAELFGFLRNKKYFTSIDLKDGFFQVPIKHADKEKTAFHTGSRLMQFTKMPQGFKNSSAIFQRMMNIIFAEIIGSKCLVYIDDILVFGETIYEHDQNLQIVLNILDKYGLVENENKRIECKEKIDFLGYRIEYNKLKPNLVRAQGIIDYPAPKSKKSLQRFLGMINYDRMFIEGITKILRPLYKLLTRGRKYEWMKEQNDSFERVKVKLKNKLELAIPNFEKTFCLETDASDVGIVAAIGQEEGPIAYASRSLNKSEQQYGVSEEV